MEHEGITLSEINHAEKGKYFMIILCGILKKNNNNIEQVGCQWWVWGWVKWVKMVKRYKIKSRGYNVYHGDYS